MEDVSHFGIGLTNSGGGKGMAALDGFAAALEVRVLERLDNQLAIFTIILDICFSYLISFKPTHRQEKGLMASLLFHISYISLRHRRILLYTLYAMIMLRWIILIGILYLRKSKRRVLCGVACQD